MSTLLAVIGVTFIIIVICIFMLGIGLFVTGKTKLRLGMCGKVPTQKKSKSNKCGNEMTCPLCGNKDESDIPKEST